MAATRTILEPAELTRRLSALPSWSVEGATLTRRWEFGDFDEAMRFVNAVADVARELDHHPDLYNVYNRVRLSVTTHDAGGLTAMDIAFATRVDALTDGALTASGAESS